MKRGRRSRDWREGMMYVAAVSPLSSSPLSLIMAISFFQSCLVCTAPQKSHCFPCHSWVGGERNPPFWILFSSFILPSRICPFLCLAHGPPPLLSFCLSSSEGWRELASWVLWCAFSWGYSMKTQLWGSHWWGLYSWCCVAYTEAVDICVSFLVFLCRNHRLRVSLGCQQDRRKCLW